MAFVPSINTIASRAQCRAPLCMWSIPVKLLRPIVVALLFTAAFCGCKRSEDKGESLTVPEESGRTANTPQTKTITIGLLLKELSNPFFAQMEKGARQAEKDLGITLVVKSIAHQTAVAQQVAHIEQMIADKVNALVIVPTAAAELLPVLKKAQDANIVVLNIDEPLDPEMLKSQGLRPIPFIGVDNEQGGYLSAKAISDQITQPAKAVIIQGVVDAPSSVHRTRGAVRAFAENANLTVVAQESANWKLEEARALAERLFSKHPDIRAVFCANDVMALGVANYLQTQRKTDVLVASYDAIEEAKQAIRDGHLHATVDQQPDRQAYLAIRYALHAVQGESLAPQTTVDVKLLTPAILAGDGQ